MLYTREDLPNGENPKVWCSYLLHQLGITSGRKGYYYLRRLIMEAYEDINLIQNITYIYKKYADEVDANWHSVERCVREVIVSGWKKANMDVVDLIFGYTMDDTHDHPSNTEFVADVADYMRLMTGKEENLLRAEYHEPGQRGRN